MDGGHIQSFEWDALGRLIKSKNDKAETHYRYDPFGRRIEKSKQDSINRNYTETTQYGWDGDTLAFESTHQYTKHYVYEMGSFIPLIQASYRQQINQHQTPTWDNGYDIDKDPLWQTTQKAEKFDRVWFYHCDHLGTPQEMTDQTGAIVWSAEYKAWGECKAKTFVKRDIWDSEIITNNIRFQGQYYDQETGLHYNRYRYYSPYVGRFISKDPIGLLGGENNYQYAPNPVGWVDPQGLICEYGVAGYKNKVHENDNLEAHELIQNAWLRQNNYINGRASGIARSNPAIALQPEMHSNISKLQTKYKMGGDNLKSQDIMQHINRNTALTRKGIYDDLVKNRGWEPANAKKYATDKAMGLRQDAINYAKENCLMKPCGLKQV